MKSTIKRSLQALLIVPVLALGVSVAVPSDANAQLDKGINATGQEIKDVTADSLVTRIVNWFLFIVGAIAVIMLIYGGFKYITSAGDASNVTAAKNTILYAVIGLIVVVLAGTIVNFVLNDLLNGPQ